MGNQQNKEIDTSNRLDMFATNKKIPKIISHQALTALSYYPELKDTCIRFVFTRELNHSVMAARPVVSTLFQPRHKRAYDILISPVFKLTQRIEPIHQIPEEVMIGWLGHELGHIMDYEDRTTLSIAKFGLLYWLSKPFLREAERVADTFAISRGMGAYILSTREFILGHSGLSQRYKAKIARLYLSPDDIVELVTEIEQKSLHEREEILDQETNILSESLKGDSQK